MALVNSHPIQTQIGFNDHNGGGLMNSSGVSMHMGGRNKTMTNLNIRSPRNRYVRVRYNGNAFGGFQMTDSLFPRKSNLCDRKQKVLRIAAENFQMVQRLQGVRSTFSNRFSASPHSSRGDSVHRMKRPKSSQFAAAYPNMLNPGNSSTKNRLHHHRIISRKMNRSQTQTMLAPMIEAGSVEAYNL